MESSARPLVRLAQRVTALPHRLSRGGLPRPFRDQVPGDLIFRHVPARCFQRLSLPYIATRRSTASQPYQRTSIRSSRTRSSPRQIPAPTQIGTKLSHTF